MARIRSVKPEFFFSESLAKVSDRARLTFIGLWTQADDYGIGISNARFLTGQLWSMSDISPGDVMTYLKELEMTGHLAFFEVDEKAYYHVLSWEKHQSKKLTRGARKYPAPPCTPEGADCTGTSAGVRNREQGTGNRERDEQASIFEADFDECWKHYPRKISRLLALHQYLLRRKENVSKEDLLKATQNFAAQVKMEERQEKFILHGATFYGPNERWVDYLKTAGQTPRRSHRGTVLE